MHKNTKTELTKEDANVGSQIRRATKWTMGGTIATEFANFLFGLILARILIPADFGMIATIGVVTGIAGFFSGAGTGQALVRAREIEQRHVSVVLTLQLMIGLSMFAIIAISAPYFALYFEDQRYRSLLTVAALNFVVKPFANIPQALLQRSLNLKPIVVIDIIVLVVVNLLAIVLAYSGYGPWALIVSGLAGSIVKALFLGVRGLLRYALCWDREIVKELGGYGIRLTANSILEHLRGHSITLILSKTFGPSEVGLYNRASSLAGIPMLAIGRSPYQAVFRALSANQDNLDKSRYIYFRAITLITVYTLPLYVIGWWVAEPGIRFLYGEKWISAALPLQILTLAGVFRCVANPSGAVVEARNRVSSEIKINVLSWIVLVCLLMVAGRYGVVGVACAAAITSAIFCSLIATLVLKELRATWRSLSSALFPAMQMNMCLILILSIFEFVIPRAMRIESPGLYSVLIGGFGMVFYAALFIMFPPESVKSESEMWRGKIHGVIRRVFNG